MIFFSILVFLLSVFEIRTMAKSYGKRGVIVYIVLASITLMAGYYYFSNPYRESLGHKIMNLMGKRF